MESELCVLLELLRPELPFWTSFISGYLSAADLYCIFCSCKTLSAWTEDENFWRLRWQSFRPKLKATRPPLGLQSWKAAHQHLALFRSPEQIQEVGAAGLEKDLLSDVTCALHAESGLRAFGYSDGSVRVVRPCGTAGGGPTSAVPHELNSANVTTYTLGSGSIRHMQLSEDGSTLYVGCWAGAVHHILLTHRSPTLASTPGGVNGTRTARAPSVDETEGTDSPASTPAQAQSAPAAEVSTNRVVASMQGPIYALRLDRGVLYTCCGDGTIQAWDSSTGEMVGTLEGHTAGVTDFCAVRLAVTSPASDSMDAACSPVSRTHYLPLLISSSYDGTVRVWKSIAHTAATRRRAHHAPLLTLRGHRGPVWTVAAEGTTIYSGSADGSVRVWSINVAPEEYAAYGQAEPMHMLTGSCLAVLQHTGALVGADVLAADQLSSSPAPTAQQGGVGGAAVAGAHNRKQIWCLKLFGPLVITGSSDGALSCWDTECLRSQMDAASVQRPVLAGSHVPSCVPSGNGIGGGVAATGALGTPRAAVPVLLWNIAGPGCDGLGDGVRRMDVVRNTIYTTTKHGNVGIARLSSPLLGLPEACAAPDVAFEPGSGGTQGSSAAIQTVSSFRANSSEPTAFPSSQAGHSAPHSIVSAFSPAPGPVTPTGKTASGGAGSSWEGSSSSVSSADGSTVSSHVPRSSSSLSPPLPPAGILSYPEATHTPMLSLAAQGDSSTGGYHVATGQLSIGGTRSSRAGSDGSRVSVGSGPSVWVEQAGSQPRHAGTAGSPGARGRPPPSPVRVGSGPCSNVRV